MTYTLQQGVWSWGSKLSANLRFDKSDNDYQLGNAYSLTMWGVRKVNRFMSSSLRLDGKRWGNIEGADPELNPMLVATSRTDLRAGASVDLLLGVDFVGRKGTFKGNRLGVEVGVPGYQNLTGPQLKKFEIACCLAAYFLIMLFCLWIFIYGCSTLIAFLIV